MPQSNPEYYSVTTRGMLREARTIGRVPFILFQYYQTWLTAPYGIKPPLDTIADDLDMEKPAICNARSVLVKHGWIRYENEQVFIEKTFISYERDSSHMNEDSSHMNGTEVANIGTLKKEIKEEEHRGTRAASENKFIDLYHAFYPEAQLTIFALQLIEQRIKDDTRWQATLTFWKGNGYRARSVDKMCDYYDQLKSKAKGVAPPLRSVADIELEHEEARKNLKPPPKFV